MTAPAQALQQLGISCLLGALLGLLYAFLRPLRPRHTGLADSLFLLALGRALLVLAFGVCGGDLRLGCAAGLGLGFCGTEPTLGRALGPIFSGFWKKAAAAKAFLIRPLKKFSHIAKNMFASGE